jgi:hypothetical protein
MRTLEALGLNLAVDEGDGGAAPRDRKAAGTAARAVAAADIDAVVRRARRPR